MFRRKSSAEFQSLYEWLLDLISRNESSGVDQSVLLADNERADILDAVARMHSRFGLKPSLDDLATRLHDGETVRFIAGATYDDHRGIVALTGSRLLSFIAGR